MDTRATGCYPSRCRKQLCRLLFAYEFKHCSRVSVAHCLNICSVVLCCICVRPSSCTSNACSSVVHAGAGAATLTMIVSVMKHAYSPQQQQQQQ
ncbi:hypothetical protein BDZ97DRAFT_1394448 [Flammula alnicola]|nr:hypothetical protein BDZ97DRAFT_610626 [Flammula alnicola]KAF8959437.1 hypothetical protein BDZ97DRAFT_1394448 [Flammula alnicola]